jgi:hypothetical protein
MFASAVMYAQSPPPSRLGRFLIGVDFVGPSTKYPIPNTPENGGTYLHYSTGAETAPGNGEEDDIPIERWEQLRDLGLDLALVGVSHLAMRSDGVRRIRRMAGEYGILLGIADVGIGDGATNYSRAERLLYHVESAAMVDTSKLDCVTDTALIVPGWDASVYPLTPWNNAVRFPNAGVPRGYLLNRTGPPPDQVYPYQGILHKDGIYYLSVRLRYDVEATHPSQWIPNDSTIVLRLDVEDERVETQDSYLLRGSDFYTQAGVIDTAHEFLLDIIRVEYDAAADVVEIQRGLAVNPDSTVPWPAINGGAVIVPRGGTRRIPFSLTYMPGDTRRPVLYVDAVGLSCGKAFALFNPGHRALPSTWHPTPREFLARGIDTLCGATGPPPPVFVYMQESTGNSGNWATAGLVSHMVRERSGGRTGTFLYGGGGMGYDNLALFTAAFRLALQSVYYYPYPLMKRDFITPAFLPWQQGYYAEQYDDGRWFPHTSERTDGFRTYAEFRRDGVDAGDWVPAIQNHSYGSREGDPHGAAATDLVWTREPTLLEQKLAVHLALSYGAKGIVYYLFGGVPGYDTTDATTIGGRGFLTFDHCKRAFNDYGERLWDSLRAFHHGPLRMIGDTLYPLEWREGMSVEGWQSGVLPSRTVLRIRAEGQDGWDAPGNTFVEASEFVSPTGGDSLRYLFLVNKRVNPWEGRRLNIAFGRGDVGAAVWRIIDVMAGDTTLLPVFGNGVYYPAEYNCDVGAAEARLLRLEAIRGSDAALPADLEIQPPFPQPADASVMFRVSIPEDAPINISVFDQLGRCVRSHTQEGVAGMRLAVVETDRLPAGLYLVAVESGGQVKTSKMIVMH